MTPTVAPADQKIVRGGIRRVMRDAPGEVRDKCLCGTGQRQRENCRQIHDFFLPEEPT